MSHCPKDTSLKIFTQGQVSTWQKGEREKRRGRGLVGLLLGIICIDTSNIRDIYFCFPWKWLFLQDALIDCINSIPSLIYGKLYKFRMFAKQLLVTPFNTYQRWNKKRTEKLNININVSGKQTCMKWDLYDFPRKVCYFFSLELKYTEVK